MTSAILFDFYGVFIPDAYNTWLAANNLERTDIYADLAARFDSGEISQDQFLTELSAAVGRPVSYKEIHVDNPPINAGVVSIVQNLSKTYPIGLLSNASTSLRAKLTELELDSLFDHIFISSELGVNKPHPEIYQIALAGMKMRPEQVVFIDDNPTNIAAAKQLDIPSILYSDVDTLQLELAKSNIAL